MDIKDTASEQNVKKAFMLESQARNKYTYFAAQAKNEGHERIAALFEEMAGNEREHAKVWYKMLNNGIPGSLKNLEDAANSEHAEWKSMYPGFAKTAREEGFELLAIMFENIAAIEKNHEALFAEMLEEYKSGKIQSPAASGVYVCTNCGAIAPQKPDVCHVCWEKDTFVAK